MDVLKETNDRFTFFPIQHADIYDLYRNAVSSFWIAQEIDMSKDKAAFDKLTNNEQHFIKMTLAFFAGSDGIICENIAAHFLQEVQLPESRAFWSYQIFNEQVHGETYALMIDSLVKDRQEKTELFRAINYVPIIKRKADFALKHMDNALPFNRRLFAFGCVEAISFSASFAAIYWLKSRHVDMAGLILSNSFIARDEATHAEHCILLYSKISRLTDSEAHEVVRECVDIERIFTTEAVPCRMLGMNSDLMMNYIEFVADRFLVQCGHPKLYHATNPFNWMELLSLDNKTNFFETRVSEYALADRGLISEECFL